MPKKYICMRCGWYGDEPKYSHEGNEGWLCCPNGCIDENGDPEEVVLFIKYYQNVLNYIWAYTR